MSDSTTVRISKTTYQDIKELAEIQKINIQSVVEYAIKQYKKAVYFRELEQSYQSLKKDTTNWEQEKAERKSWDNAVMDGINEK